MIGFTMINIVDRLLKYFGLEAYEGDNLPKEERQTILKAFIRKFDDLKEVLEIHLSELYVRSPVEDNGAKDQSLSKEIYIKTN